jgi:hypothetical protein
VPNPGRKVPPKLVRNARSDFVKSASKKFRRAMLDLAGPAFRRCSSKIPGNLYHSAPEVGQFVSPLLQAEASEQFFATFQVEVS